jgi:hypothetical protein
MGGACSAHGGHVEICTKLWLGSHLEELDVDGRIILKWLLRK